MKAIRSFFLCMAICGAGISTAFAETEVEDLGEPASFESESSGIQVYGSEHATQRKLSMAERTERLERQIETLTNAKLLSKLEELQQSYQQVRGDLEKQSHDLLVLKDQQKQFYQDISQRLAQSSQSASTPAATSTTTAAVQPKPATAPTATVANTSAEVQMYREAFEKLKAKQYDEAANAFKAFSTKFPTSAYTVNAYYWLGEIYYLQGKVENAKQAFNAVIQNYPDCSKVPDALLKLATIEIDSSNIAQAKVLLQKILKNYPDTTAAKLAGIRVQELKLSS